MATVLADYESRREDGRLKPDPAQRAVAQRFDALASALEAQPSRAGCSGFSGRRLSR